MVGRVPGGRPVDDIVRIKELFALHSLEEDPSTRSLGGFLGEMETPAVQVTNVQELNKGLKEGESKDESFAAGSVVRQ